MTPRALLRTLLAAVMFPVALLASAGAHAEMFACSMDGALHARACCGGRHHHAAPQSADHLGRAACCSEVDVDSAPAPATTGPAQLALTAALAPPPPRLLPFAPVLAGDDDEAPPREVVPRAGADPPLHVLHCALLI